MKTQATQLNAVIGYPLSHSRSPMLHNPVYKRLKIDAILVPFSHRDVRALVAAIRALPIHLTAVTMPHKQTIMPLLDAIDPDAKKVGAVNTVVNRQGKLIGYNTDIDGIRYALRDTKLRNRTVLLIGAGGAANAAASAVRKAGGKLLYMNRTAKKAQALRKRFGGEVCSEQALNAEAIDVIINATPLGMHPDEKRIPIPERLLRKGQTVFDLVYNPPQTKLLVLAKRRGARTVSGLDMFAVQGLRQIELWTGKKIITTKLVETVKRNLLKSL